MEDFYYRILPREGYIFGAVAYAGSKPAGFVAATLDSEGFMKAALCKHFLSAAWVVSCSLLRDPRRVTAVWEAFRIMMSRSPPEAGALTAEALSLGVLPEFRRSASCLDLAGELMKYVSSVFERRGIAVARLIVNADNTRAQRCFERMGWKLARTGIPGWRTPSVEFVWRPVSQAKRRKDR